MPGQNILAAHHPRPKYVGGPPGQNMLGPMYCKQRTPPAKACHACRSHLLENGLSFSRAPTASSSKRHEAVRALEGPAALLSGQGEALTGNLELFCTLCPLTSRLCLLFDGCLNWRSSNKVLQTTNDQQKVSSTNGLATNDIKFQLSSNTRLQIYH